MRGSDLPVLGSLALVRRRGRRRRRRGCAGRRDGRSARGRRARRRPRGRGVRGPAGLAAGGRIAVLQRVDVLAVAGRAAAARGEGASGHAHAHHSRERKRQEDVPEAAHRRSVKQEPRLRDASERCDAHCARDAQGARSRPADGASRMALVADAPTRRVGDREHRPAPGQTRGDGRPRRPRDAIVDDELASARTQANARRAPAAVGDRPHISVAELSLGAGERRVAKVGQRERRAGAQRNPRAPRRSIRPR